MFKKLLNTILLLSISFTSFADDNASDKLIQSLKNINTFQAQFSQKIRDANGQHVSKAQGEMVVQRPGKFYWKTKLPDPILVVADGHTLWTYDIQLSQVTKQDLKLALANSPATLLAGEDRKSTRL